MSAWYKLCYHAKLSKDTPREVFDEINNDEYVSVLRLDKLNFESDDSYYDLSIKISEKYGPFKIREFCLSLTPYLDKRCYPILGYITHDGSGPECFFSQEQDENDYTLVLYNPAIGKDIFLPIWREVENFLNAESVQLI
jgi:hypothetical protein